MSAAGADDPQLNRPQAGFGYRVSKTYTHSIGLSCCFRQWRAQSHCRFLHGYALQFRVEFETVEGLDDRHWVVDFGALKSFRGWLEEMFDHRTLVAQDDPQLALFRQLHEQGLIQLREVPASSCEAFARMVFDYLQQWLPENGYAPERVRLRQVEVREHDGNGASYGRLG